MKTIIAAILLLAASVKAQIIPCQPNESNCFSGNLVNVTGQSVSQKWPIDMSAFDGSRVSAQVVSSSQTFAAVTFKDGRQATGSITLANNSAANTGLRDLTVTIGGEVFLFGPNGNVAIGNTSTNTATNLAAAINADSVLSPILSAAAVGVVVTATSTVDGAAYNLLLASGSYTAGSSSITLSGAAMVNGATPAWQLNSGVINISQHGLTTGLPVLYKQATPAIGGLVNQTTYYAIAYSGNQVELADVSTDAVAGKFIVLTSSNASSTGAQNTYTLTPLGWTGSASFIWQASDDNVNWITAPSTGTVSISSNTAAGNLGVDFGFFNYRWLRFNFTAPTTGGENLTVPVQVKQDGIGRF